MVVNPGGLVCGPTPRTGPEQERPLIRWRKASSGADLSKVVRPESGGGGRDRSRYIFDHARETLLRRFLGDLYFHGAAADVLDRGKCGMRLDSRPRTANKRFRRRSRLSGAGLGGRAKPRRTFRISFKTALGEGFENRFPPNRLFDGASGIGFDGCPDAMLFRSKLGGRAAVF